MLHPIIKIVGRRVYLLNLSPQPRLVLNIITSFFRGCGRGIHTQGASIEDEIPIFIGRLKVFEDSQLSSVCGALGLYPTDHRHILESRFDDQELSKELCVDLIKQMNLLSEKGGDALLNHISSSWTLKICSAWGLDFNEMNGLLPLV